MACIGLLALLRLCHVGFLWSDEDYHMAAAIKILAGKVPYRDFWYDKPPLAALYYVLIGGFPGFPLRLLDAGYVLVACWLIYRIADTLWSEREGLAAAFLLSFFLAFYLPAAVIPFAVDGVMMVPHLAAVLCAIRRRPFFAGLWAGLAFLANIKGLFVLLTCVLWSSEAVLVLMAGFAIPLLLFFAALLGLGAWAGYVEQVWRWGLSYSAEGTRTRGFIRTLNWLGFHAALLVGAIAAVIQLHRKSWKVVAWLALSFVAAALGWRFNPRYFLQVLPPLAVLGAYGVVYLYRRSPRFAPVVFAALLLVPLVRFLPRYVQLAADAVSGARPHWADLLLDIDSQQVAAKLNATRQPDSTLMVWGYRPDIYVYTRMFSDSFFWDSQPLTGVDAGRALSSAETNYGPQAAANRQRFVHSQPTFFVDSLSIFNPKLSPSEYPEIRKWLRRYRLIGMTHTSLIYQRIQ